MTRIFFTVVSFVFFFSCQNSQKNSVPELEDPALQPIKQEKKKEEANQKEDVADDKVYLPSTVDVKPDYSGGMDKFYIFLKKNYVVPEAVIENEIIDRPVFANFIIQKDGTLTDIKIVRDFGFGTGLELHRVLKLSPKWIPAMKEGKPVKCTYNIPYYVQY